MCVCVCVYVCVCVRARTANQLEGFSEELILTAFGGHVG